MTQGAVPLPGYPSGAAFAAKEGWVGDFFGSNNYQLGGYNLNASSLGMSGFEWVNVSALTQSGTYFPRINYPAKSGNAEIQAPAFPYVVVKWYYAANSVEVANNTNLSGEVAQMFALGI